MGDTSIEWTDKTWNPVRGCSRISLGCGGPNGQGGCYAEKIAARFSKPGQAYEGLAKMVGGVGRWTGKLKLVDDAVGLPLRWRKPRKIFVNSMSDLFHENVPFDWIDIIFAVMALAPNHTFQILTKRAARMAEYLNDQRVRDRVSAEMWKISKRRTDHIHGGWPLSNVWLGVSVENQDAADERVPHLLNTPAAVRFLSCEPLIGPVELEEIPHPPSELSPCSSCGGKVHINALTGAIICENVCDAPTTGAIDWVIVGGESGHGPVRPMHPEWAKRLRDQCASNGVAYFFKQWGEYQPQFPQYAEEFGMEEGDMTTAGRDFPAEGVMYRDGYFYDGEEHQPHTNNGAYWIERIGKKRAGRELDGRTWDEFPKVRA